MIYNRLMYVLSSILTLNAYSQIDYNQLKERFKAPPSFAAVYAGITTNGTNKMSVKYNSGTRQLLVSSLADGSSLLADCSVNEGAWAYFYFPNQSVRKMYASDAMKSDEPMRMFFEVLSLYRERKLRVSPPNVKLTFELTISTSSSGVKFGLLNFLLSDDPIRFSWLEEIKTRSCEISENNEKIFIKYENGRVVTLDGRTGLLQKDVSKTGDARVELLELSLDNIDFSDEINRYVENCISMPEDSLIDANRNMLQQINDALPSQEELDEFLHVNHESLCCIMNKIGKDIFNSRIVQNDLISNYINEYIIYLQDSDDSGTVWVDERQKARKELFDSYLSQEQKRLEDGSGNIIDSLPKMKNIVRLYLPMIIKSFVNEIIFSLEKEMRERGQSRMALP